MTKKIAFVLGSNIQSWAGMEHVLFEYCKYRPEDVEVSIFQSNYISNERIRSEEVNRLFKNINIVEMPDYYIKLNFLNKSKPMEFLNEILFTPILNFFLRYTKLKPFRESLESFEVVYFFNTNRETGLNLRKTIKIGSTHAWVPSNQSFFKKIEARLVERKFIFRGIDHFHVFPSQKNVLKTYEHGKILCIPNGVSSDSYIPRTSSSKDRIKFLFNSRLENCKGLKIVLEAFQKLPEQMTLELHIVGSGSLLSFAKNSQSKRIFIHGFVPENKLPEIMADCDVLIYPSQCDSFPLVVLNALSSGLHVITTAIIASNIDRFETTNYIDVIEPNAELIRIKMLQSIANIEDIRGSKQKLHDLIKHHYSWKEVSREFFDLITKYETV